MLLEAPQDRKILPGLQNKENQEDQSGYLRRVLPYLVADPKLMTPAGLYCTYSTFAANGKLEAALLLGKSTPPLIADGAVKYFQGSHIKYIAEEIEKRFGFNYPVVFVVADERCIDGKFDGDVLHGQWGSIFGEWIEGDSPMFGVCRGRNTWPVLIRERNECSIISILEFTRSLRHELLHAAVRAYFLQVLEDKYRKDISISRILGAGAWEDSASFPLLDLWHYLLQKKSEYLGEKPIDYSAERIIDGIPAWMSNYIWTIIFRNIGNQDDAPHLDPLKDERWTNGINIFLKTAQQILKINQQEISQKPNGWLTMETLSQLGFNLNLIYQELLYITKTPLFVHLPWGMKDDFWRTAAETQVKLQTEWSMCLPNWTLLSGITSDAFRYIKDGWMEKASV